jgi:AcrR family transcriptional regulator
MGKRARSEEAKDDRREQLRDAARALLDAGRSVPDVTMAEVARMAGLAKGTAYLYHPTKEALFLDVAGADLAAWARSLYAAIHAVPPVDAADLADRIVDTIVVRPRLIALLAEVHATLEQNIDVAAATTFKRGLAALLLEADAELGPFLPHVQPGDGARLLVTAHALVVGFSGMSRPSAAVAQALTDPELAWMRVDFAESLRGALKQVLRGW